MANHFFEGRLTGSDVDKQGSDRFLKSRSCWNDRKWLFCSFDVIFIFILNVLVFRIGVKKMAADVIFLAVHKISCEIMV